MARVRALLQSREKRLGSFQREMLPRPEETLWEKPSQAATWGELGKMDLSQCPLCLSSLGKEKPKDSGDISLWI